MPLSSEHKALVFVGLVAALGAGVRVVRARAIDAAPVVQPALDHQIAASDSAKTAKRQKGSRAKRTKPGDSSAAVARVRRAPRGNGPLDRPGYINGKLDLDVATAAQADSLAGVTATMARRIVADRMQRGPFLSIDGLRRVPGAGPKFIDRIDTLVTFSGTLRPPSPADSIIPPRARAKRGTTPAKGTTPPAEPRTPVPR